MMLLLLFLSKSWAQEWVLEVSEPHELPSGGTWLRPFPTPEGWKTFLGGNALRVADLKKEENTWTATNIRVISDQDGVDFNDHSIKKCPDGTFLHMASRDSNQPNDSAHVWRYDSDFSILASTVWEEASTERQYNDGSILCARLSQGIASSTQGEPMDFGNHYFDVDEQGEKGSLISLAPYPRMNGGALIADDLEQRIYGLGMAHGQPLQINTYDQEWNVLSEKTLDLLDGDKRAYWPQGVIRVGDYYLISFMGRDDRWGNGDQGDVFVGILDLDWNLQKVHQVTHYEANAAMRPWISRSGDQVLVAYDANLKYFVVEMQIDLDVFGLDEDSLDTAVDPTLWDVYFPEEEKDSSCGGGNAGALIVFLALIPFARRESNAFEDPC
jgi:hypothetical protein